MVRHGLSDRADYNKNEQTPPPTRNLSSHPREPFTAVLSVFQAHFPAHDKLNMRSLWNGKSKGEKSGNTDRLASHHKIDLLDSYSVSCHRLRGY